MVRRSSDGGADWIHLGFETSGMPNVAFFDLRISPDGQRVIAFTHGREAFRLVTKP